MKPSRARPAEAAQPTGTWLESPGITLLRERSARWWVSLALVIAVAAIYAQAGRYPFHGLDDEDYVQNAHVLKGLSWDGVVWAFTTSHAANWHPLTWLSHMLDARLFGTTDQTAGGHHLVSAAIHALNAVLLFHALRRLTTHLWPSALVAALFAVHPLRVESVAWASERKDVLSGLFFMLALLAYGRYVRRPGWRRMLPVLGSHMAGLLAKPMLVTLPMVLLALDLWPLQRWRVGRGRPAKDPLRSAAAGKVGGALPLRRLLLEKAPLLAASLGSSIMTVVAQRSGGAVAELGAIPWESRIYNALVSYATYLWKTIWPTGLACYYPHPATLPATGNEAILASACVLLLFAIGWAVLRLAGRQPYLLAGWLWYGIAMFPVIGIVQVGNQAWADRYAYLPLIGIYCMIVWLGRDLLSARPAARAIAGVLAVAVVVALGVSAHAQVKVWRDSGTLYAHALEVTKNNWFAHNGLGLFVMSQGRLEEARRHFERSLSLRPGQAGVHANLGMLFLRLGQVNRAREHLDPALQTHPGVPEALNNLGVLLVGEGRLDEARQQFERAIAARPDFPEAHFSLGLILMRQGHLDQACEHYERAAALRPSYQEALFNLALVREAQGRLDQAARAYQRVLKLRPRDAEAHHRLGRALASLGRRAEARSHFEEALKWEPSRLEARRALDSLGAAPGGRSAPAGGGRPRGVGPDRQDDRQPGRVGDPAS